MHFLHKFRLGAIYFVAIPLKSTFNKLLFIKLCITL
jgi:hypothetical protein